MKGQLGCGPSQPSYKVITKKSLIKRPWGAYLRAWDPRQETDGFLSSKQIMEDVEKVIYETLFKLYEARGTVAKGLGMRRGWRNDLGLKKLPRGGKCEKKTQLVKKWVHPDALASYNERMKSQLENEFSQLDFYLHCYLWSQLVN